MSVQMIVTSPKNWFNSFYDCDALADQFVEYVSSEFGYDIELGELDDVSYMGDIPSVALYLMYLDPNDGENSADVYLPFAFEGTRGVPDSFVDIGVCASSHTLLKESRQMIPLLPPFLENPPVERMQQLELEIPDLEPLHEVLHIQIEAARASIAQKQPIFFSF